MPKAKPNPVVSNQLDRFKEAARALECDDDPKAFEKVMTKIAKAKPTAKTKG
jgi:hypothetical protein